MKEWVSINIYGDLQQPISRRELAEAMHEVNLALDRLCRRIDAIDTRLHPSGDGTDTIRQQNLPS